MKLLRIPVVATAVVLAGLLAACQQSPAPEPQETPETPAAPDSKPGTSLTQAELILPVLEGRPGVAYFSLGNGSKQPVSIVSAYVEGATSAEIHGTSAGSMEKREAIEVKPGETVTFSRGGLHVMAFELSEELRVGGTTELTLTFADGDKITAPAAIKAGGSDGDNAHGMGH